MYNICKSHKFWGEICLDFFFLELEIFMYNIYVNVIKFWGQICLDFFFLILLLIGLHVAAVLPWKKTQALGIITCLLCCFAKHLG